MDKKMELFCSKEILDRTLKNGVSKRIPREAINAFCDVETRAMIAYMIANGEWHIAPPYIQEIPKDNSKVREVKINQPLDRIIAAQMLQVYMELYKEHINRNCVFSYLKGIGVPHIVKDIIYKYIMERKFRDGVVLTIDITSFFDSVPKELLNETLDKFDTGSPLDKMNKEYMNQDLVIDLEGNLVHKYMSLMQGYAMSTFLADVILKDIDDTMETLPVLYVRYSDDILIIGEREEAYEAKEVLIRLLNEKQLEVNPAKVHEYKDTDWFTFLGCSIKRGHISMSKKSVINLEREINDCIKGVKVGNEKSLMRAVNRVNEYLYLMHVKNAKNFGWAEYFFNIMTDEHDVTIVDEWIKDKLRAAYTGKTDIGGIGVSKLPSDRYALQRGKGKHVKSNIKETKDVFAKCNYISMVHFWKTYKANKDAFRIEILRLTQL